MGQADECQIKESEAAAILICDGADLTASDPQIDQPQGEPEPQPVPPRRSGGRPCADLMALSVPALHAETSPVILKDLLDREAPPAIDRGGEISDLVVAASAPHNPALRPVRRFGRAPGGAAPSLMPDAVKMLVEAARAPRAGRAMREGPRRARRQRKTATLANP